MPLSPSHPLTPGVPWPHLLGFVSGLKLGGKLEELQQTFWAGETVQGALASSQEDL